MALFFIDEKPYDIPDEKRKELADWAATQKAGRVQAAEKLIRADGQEYVAPIKGKLRTRFNNLQFIEGHKQAKFKNEKLMLGDTEINSIDDFTSGFMSEELFNNLKEKDRKKLAAELAAGQAKAEGLREGKGKALKPETHQLIKDFSQEAVGPLREVLQRGFEGLMKPKKKETQVSEPAKPLEEQDFFTGDLGIGQIGPIPRREDEPTIQTFKVVDSDFGTRIKNVFELPEFSQLKSSAKSSLASAEIAVQLASENPDEQIIVDNLKISEENKPSKELVDLIESDSAEEFITRLAKSPVKLIPELLANSLPAQIAVGLRTTPKQVAAGAATATAAGLVGGPATGLAALPIGVAAGFSKGVYDTSKILKSGELLLEAFNQLGIDPSDPEQLKAAFQNEEQFAQLKQMATTLAVPVAALDAMSAVVGGKLFAQPAKGFAGKLAQFSVEMGLQMGLGGGGEALSQAAGGTGFKPGEIGAEIAGELAGGVGEILTGSVLQRLQKAAPSIEEIDTLNRNLDDTIRAFNKLKDKEESVGLTAEEETLKGDLEERANEIVSEINEKQVQPPAVPPQEFDIVQPAPPTKETVEQPQTIPAAAQEALGAGEDVVNKNIDPVNRFSNDLRETDIAPSDKSTETAGVVNENQMNLDFQEETTAEGAVAQTVPEAITKRDISIRNKRTRLLRDLEGLPNITPNDKANFRRDVEVAISEGMVDKADEIAELILNDPSRDLTTHEAAAIAFRVVELEDEQTALVNQSTELYAQGKAGEAAVIEITRDANREKIAKLTEASIKAGTVTSRKLSFRGYLRAVTEDFITGLKSSAQRAKNGAPLTVKEHANIERLQKELTDANEEVNEEQKKYSNAQAQLDMQEAEKNLQKEVSQVKRKGKKRSSENIQKERASILEELGNLGYATRLNDITGAAQQGAEVAVLLGRLARTYIEEGVSTIPALERKMMDAVPDLNQLNVAEILAGRKVGELVKQESVTKQRIRDLKDQGRLIVDIENALNDFFQVAKPKSKPVRRLEGLLAQLRNDANKSKRNKTRLAAINEKIQSVKDEITNQYRNIEAEKLQQKETDPNIIAAKEKLSEEIEIRSLIDQIEILKDDIKKGNLERTPKQLTPSRKISSPRLNELRAQADALNQQINELRRQARENQKNEQQLSNIRQQIARVEQEINEQFRDIQARRKSLTATPEITEAKAILAERRIYRNLLDRAAVLEDNIAKGNIKKASRAVKDVSPRVSDIRNKINVLNKDLNKIRLLAMRDERDRARLSRIFDKLERVNQQLEKGFRDIKQQRRSDPEFIVNALDELREAEAFMRTTDKISILEDQLKTGNFDLDPKRKIAVQSERVERAMVKKRKLEREARIAIDNMRPKSPLKKVVSAIARPAMFSRTMQTIGELSTMMRQGGLLVHRAVGASAVELLTGRKPRALQPVGRSVIDGFSAMFNKHSAESIQMVLENMPQQFERDKYGLDLSKLDGALNQREEDVAGRLIDIMPVNQKTKERMKNLDISAPFNRFAVVSLNILRSSAFDEVLAANPSMTDDQKKAWASTVNAFGGRGDLTKWLTSNSLEVLSLLAYAPRFAASRIEALVKLTTNLFRGRALAKQSAHTLSGFLIMNGFLYLLAKLNGWDIGDDPEEFDYGRISVGNTRLDFMAGVNQPLRLLLLTGLWTADELGLRESTKKIDLVRAYANFVKYKQGPFVSLPLSLLLGKDAIGNQLPRSEALLRAYTPLFFQDLQEAADYNIKGNKFPATTSAAAIGFFGGSVSTVADALKQPKIRKIYKDTGIADINGLSKSQLPPWATEKKYERYKDHYDYIFSQLMANWLADNENVIKQTQKSKGKEAAKEFIRANASDFRLQMKGYIQDLPEPTNNDFKGYIKNRGPQLGIVDQGLIL